MKQKHGSFEIGAVQAKEQRSLENESKRRERVKRFHSPKTKFYNVDYKLYSLILTIY
jgi:ribosomal protein S18